VECTLVDPTDHGGVDVLPMGGVDDAARTAPRCAAATSLASSTRRFDNDVDVELSRAARLGEAPASSRPGSQPSWCLDAWLTGHCDGRSRPRIARATQHLVFQRCAPRCPAPAQSRSAGLELRRGPEFTDRIHRFVRGQVVSFVRKLPPMRQLLRCVPRPRRQEGRRRSRASIRLRLCKGCGFCVQEFPCGAIEMIPEES
jgi:ferredoxin